MNLKNIASLILVFFGSVIYAQNGSFLQPLPKRQTNKQVLDSVKATFVHDNLASCIDSLWMKELASLDLYDDLTTDIKNINIDEKVDYELPTELLKERLKKMDEKSPFNIEYNQGLENVIKSFLKNRKKSFERLMGVSQFYFPLFEESLAAQNIPLEIKYLAVVESALNPRAVSRVGATGLWQFMYQTGKQYDLNINSYVDERSDPLKSSNAATQYMTNMYKIFGDWDLVLASYNSGPGNVAKAIRRSGGKQNYWNIRKYLPKETQGYLPAFLATMYIFEYHKEHGIKPDRAIANHFATDTILIKKAMTFKQISDLLDVPVAELQFLNPSYKRQEVPFITGESNYLRLPIDKIAVFTSNEDKIYAYIKYEDSRRERPYESMLASRDSISGDSTRIVSRVKYHKVRRGDSLSEISNQYGVTMSEIKKWNHLKGSKAPTGRRLKIITTEAVAYTPKIQKQIDTAAVKHSNMAVASSEEQKPAKTYKEEKVVTFKDVVKKYKIKKGDNLSEISNNFDVAVADIKKWNNIKGNNISVGKSLKIIKNEKVVSVVKKEIKAEKQLIADTKEETALAVNNTKQDAEEKPSDFYVVQKEDNLFSISKKFNVSITDLKEWNNIEDNIVKVGSTIALTQKDKNDNNIAEKTEIKTVEYTVVKNDNLGKIASKYAVSLADLKEWNNLEDNNIRLGMKLIVSKKEIIISDAKSKNNSIASISNEVKHYYVQRGDTLTKIAKKYPGVTISDIKKWNGIKGESLKPGMKLKING